MELLLYLGRYNKRIWKYYKTRIWKYYKRIISLPKSVVRQLGEHLRPCVVHITNHLLVEYLALLQ